MAMNRTTIYVKLLDENVDVWRPVDARPVGQNEYVIVGEGYDRDIERWAFEPGDRVVCDVVDGPDGRVLAAVRLVNGADHI